MLVMIIFIDESGINKRDGHSAVAFVYLCFSNVVETEKKIIEIEKQLGIKHFHWADFGSKKGWQVREDFLMAASKLDFSFKISVINNPIKFGKVFEKIFEHLIVENKIKKIVIDGKKPKWYSRKLKKVLRDKSISVKKICTANDESAPGLRFADALAGLFRSHYDKPTEKTTKLIKCFNNKITVQLMDGQMTR